jgi:hypothetical protein
VAFEPFGYRFEIHSPLAPAEVKTAIRSRSKDWTDPKNGARGWVVGPFVCLWLNLANPNGPMLFGRFKRAEAGTTITGRAGSDLNGLLLYALLLPLLALASTVLSSAPTLRQARS